MNTLIGGFDEYCQCQMTMYADLFVIFLLTLLEGSSISLVSIQI